MLKQRKILKVVDKNQTIVLDNMIEEQEILLYVNNKLFNKFICLNESIEELALGYLVDCNLISSMRQIKSLEQTNKSIKIAYTEEDNTYEAMDKDIIDLDIINNIMSDFNNGSILFQETGAIHTYGLYDEINRIIIKEDVGRHNALDKMIGYALKNDINLHNKIVVTSGRLTYEIASKIMKHPIKAIISISTPTITGIDIFEENKITAIGFARGNRFNVYTNLDNYLK